VSLDDEKRAAVKTAEWMNWPAGMPAGQILVPYRTENHERREKGERSSWVSRSFVVFRDPSASRRWVVGAWWVGCKGLRLGRRHSASGGLFASVGDARRTGGWPRLEGRNLDREGREMARKGQKGFGAFAFFRGFSRSKRPSSVGRGSVVGGRQGEGFHLGQRRSANDVGGSETLGERWFASLLFVRLT